MRYFRYQPLKVNDSYTVGADEGRNAKKGGVKDSTFIMVFASESDLALPFYAFLLGFFSIKP